MPRIRTLKPEHKVHRKVGQLEDRPYRLWVGLVTEADDEGRFVADADQLRALVFPYQTRLTTAKVDAALDALASVGLVTLYRSNGTRYGCFPDWTEHQKISHAIPSKLPPCSEDSRILQKPPEDSVLARARGSDHEGIKDHEGKGAPNAEPSAPALPTFQIPESIRTALTKCNRLRDVLPLYEHKFWQAQIRARPQVDFAAQLLKAEAWIAANPRKAPKSDYAAFLQRWFAREAERLEETR